MLRLSCEDDTSAGPTNGPRRIRTCNTPLLRRMPLPIGLLDRCAAPSLHLHRDCSFGFPLFAQVLQELLEVRRLLQFLLAQWRRVVRGLGQGVRLVRLSK